MQSGYLAGEFDGTGEGARSADGRVTGTYVHGLLSDDRYRASFLTALGHPGDVNSYSDAVEAALDELADGLESALDIDKLFGSARKPNWEPGAV